MNSREQILARLRSQTAILPAPEGRPKSYLPVTQSNDDLIARFTAEVERLTGKVYHLRDEQAVLDQVVSLLGQDTAVLGWDALPISTLAADLARRGVSVITNQSGKTLPELAAIRVGITGAEAGFSTTGTLALVSRKGEARLPSLLPPVHIALLKQTNLFPRMEDWLQSRGRNLLLESASIAFITGPSRTSDIEMQTILGVHGPKEVHILLYE